MNRYKNLIIITLIAILILTIFIRENQHAKTLLAITEKEVQQEEARLEVYRKFTENYNDLQEENLRLTTENLELKYGNQIKWGRFTITGYTQYDDGCDNLTSINLNLNDGWTRYFRFVAVDPEKIPYGSVVIISIDNDFIIALAVDCGGVIKGNRFDLYFDTLGEAYDFGVKENVLVGVIK